MDQKHFEGRRFMLSEKVLFALNNVDDSFLEEANELLERSAPTQHALNKRTLRVILIAAVLAALLAACGIGYSIHQRRQQELRENLKIEENNVTSYKEYESQPQSDASGVTLLSTVNDGELQKVFVDVSPVEKDIIDRYPETVGFAWKLDGMNLNGEEYWMTARPNLKDDSSISDEGDIHEAVLNDAYDEKTKTLTLKFSILNTAIAQAQAYENSERVHLTLTLWDRQAQADANVGLSAEWLNSQKSFGSVWFVPSDREVRYFEFNHLLYYNEELDRELEILGLELTPFSAIWKMHFEGAEKLHNPNADWDAHKPWAMLEEKIAMEAKLVFPDGSDFSTGGSQTSIFEDGVVKLYCSWDSAINIDNVQRIVFGDLILWE